MLNDRYEIIKPIKSGGFGEVYFAKDHNLGIEVALKRFHLEQMAAKVGGIKMAEKYSVINEIRRAILFQHPNVCRYFDAFRHEEGSTFGVQHFEIGVMEYISGGDLHAYLQKHGINSEKAKKALIGVLEGLSYLHEQGVIHRDIKPNNILVSGDTPKIIDFGISKETEKEGNTSTMLFTSPGYVAPEQIDNITFGIDQKISFNVDLWAFGVMLYSLCTDKMPFGTPGNTDETRSIFRNTVLTQSIDALDWAGISDTFKDVIKACLVKDAKKRVKTAKEVINMLSGGFTQKPPGYDGGRTPDTKPGKQVNTKPDISENKPNSHNKIKNWKLIIGFIGLLTLIGYFIYPILCLENKYTVLGDIEKNMVEIPFGTYNSGCNDAFDTSSCLNETKKIMVSNFKISKYEVIQRQWNSIMNDYPNPFDYCAECPITYISFNMAKEFIDKLNKICGQSEFYRLPTNYEFEYAGLCNQKTKFAGSSNLDEVAVHFENSGRNPKNVGSKKANKFGLYDISGNANEFCLDLRFGEEIGSTFMLKGGGFMGMSEDEFDPMNMYSTEDKTFKVSDWGFRLVLVSNLYNLK